MEEQIDNPLHDLIEIIHFTENVSAKIHGILDEAEIYRTIKEEFVKSKYTVSIMLLTDDGSKLKIAEVSTPPQIVRAAEKATGLQLKEYTIDLNKSTVYSKIVREGKTVQVCLDDIVCELFPQPVASLLSKILNYREKPSILTPLKRQGKIIGAVTISSTELAEHLIPSVKNLAQHISTALELTDEYAKRKQAEKALKSANARLQHLVSESPTVIFSFKLGDNDPEITFISENIKERLGYEPSEFIGNIQSWKDCVHPEDLPRLVEALPRLLQEGEIVDEYRFKHKNGTYRWLHDEKKVLSKEGKPEIIGSWIDITERKQAEKALQESEEKLRSTLSSMDDLVFLLDREGAFVDYYQPLNVPHFYVLPEEFIGKSFKEVLPPSVTTSLEAAINTVRATGTAQQFDYSLEISDKKMWFSANVSMHKDMSGKFAGVTIVTRDITKRKQAEQALKRYSAEQELLLDTIETQIWYLKDTKTYGTVNKAHADFLGVTKDYLAYQNLYDILDKEVADICVDGNVEVFKTKKQIRTEEWVFNGKGENRLLAIVKSPMLDENGRVEYVVCSAEDITDRRQIEEEKDGILYDLGERVKELSCLYGIDEIMKREDVTVEEVLKETVHLIPPSWRYPAITGCCITLERKEYKTKNFTKTKWMHKADIIINDKKSGVVEVCYTDEKPAEDEDLFSKEERNLINSIAKRLEDFFERKQAEEQLQKSEEKFRSIVERSLDGIALADEQGTIIEWNQGMDRITGLKRAEVIGCPLWDVQFQLIPEEQRSQEGYEINKALSNEFFRTGQAPWVGQLYEADIQHPDGMLRSVHQLISSIETDKGFMACSIIRDITERKQAEEALRKLGRAVEQSIDGIAVADLDGTIQFVNPAWAQMHGYSEEELLGKHLSIFHTEKELRENVIPFNEQVKKVGAHEGEVEHLRKDSTVFPTWMTSTLLKDEKGNPIGMVGVARDITERRRAEEQIKASLKEKEILLREIHHRVKNNLQVISSLLNLQSEYEDTQYTEMFKESQNRIHSMALIHEKLYESENLADIDFSEYVGSLVHTLFRSYRVTGDNISLTTEVEDVSLGVDAAIPCGLIINELVSNSLKYAFPGRKGEITIKLHSVGKRIELTVTDNGVGIPDNIDFKTTESLGLDLVTTLAEQQLDGEITLDKSEGTAFHITFEKAK